jgi:hypothetical protein
MLDFSRIKQYYICTIQVAIYFCTARDKNLLSIVTVENIIRKVRSKDSKITGLYGWMNFCTCESA